jgi:hypothetical protein
MTTCQRPTHCATPSCDCAEPLDRIPVDDDHGDMTAWGCIFAAGVLLFTAVGGYIIIQLGLAVLHYWGAQ